MEFEFFMAMVPPTVTHQEKQVRVAGGKPVFYEPPELKAARQKLVAYLGQHVPDEPYHCGVRLITKWCFPRGKHLDGTYRLSKPDTDNLQKLLKDCMTKVGFWDDDALVASEIWERVAEHCHQIREQYQTMQVEVALQDVVWQLECLAKRKRGD